MKRLMEYGERHPFRLMATAILLAVFSEAIADGVVRLVLGI